MRLINIQSIIKILNQTLVQYPVAFAYIFGSLASGQPHKESDLDIALGFSEPVSDDIFYEIFKELSKHLDMPSEKLDLKNFSDLPLFVRFRVVRDGKLVYLKNEKIHRDLVVKTINYYHDQAPIFHKSSILTLKQIVEND